MATITWRNVVGPSVADAARPFELARQGLSDAFGQFDKLINQRIEARDTAAREGYMNLLYGAKTPEEMAALQQSGQLQQAFGALTPQLQAQVRAEEGKRMADLRTQAEAGFKYADTTEERNSRGALALAKTAILNDPANAGAAINALPERMRGELWASLDARQQELLRRSNDATKFDWAKEEQGWKGEKHVSDQAAAADRLKTSAAQRDLFAAQGVQARAAANRDTNAARLATLAAQNEERDRERLATAAALSNSDSLYSGSSTPERNLTNAMKAVDSRSDMSNWEKNALRKTVQNLTHYTYKDAAGKEVKVPVPYSVIESAIGGVGAGWVDAPDWQFQDRINSFMENNKERVLLDYMTRQEFTRNMLDRPTAKSGGGKK